MGMKILSKEISNALKELTLKNAMNREKSDPQKKGYLNLSKAGDVSFFKAPTGKYKIEILPYLITTDKHPRKGTPVDYLLDIWVHFGIGIMDDSFVCLKNTYRKPCSICEELDKLNLGEKEINESEINDLKPKRRCIYNIIDHGNVSKGRQLFDVSHFLFEKELLEEASSSSDEIICFADIEDGRTVSFRTIDDSFKGNTFQRYKSFKFLNRVFSKDQMEKFSSSAISLDEILVVPTYEEGKQSLLGTEYIKTGNKLEKICPYGYNFGKDCDTFDECESCKTWSICNTYINKES
jgi:hypothetical protein